jgi:integral membrane protein
MDIGERIISKFRVAARAEGISFLVLLFIAMPLKYMMDLPMAVKVVGWLHGIFFIWYWVAAVPLFTVLKWPVDRIIGLGLASILPFGTFVMERRWLSPVAAAQGVK